jgi:hypothetical protein
MKTTDKPITHRREFRLIVLGLTVAMSFLMGSSCNPGPGEPEPDSQVSGRTLDSLTGLPIDSARVSVGPDSLSLIYPSADFSDSTGAYTIYMFRYGWNYVRCSKPGYITDSLRVYYGGSVVNDSVDFLLVQE